MNLRIICFAFGLGLTLLSSDLNAQTWRFLQVTDEMDGTDASFAFVQVRVDQLQSPRLVVACNSKPEAREPFEIYVDFDDYMGRRSISVRWKIDGAEPSPRISFGVSTDGTAALVPDEKKGELLVELKTGSRVIFEGFDYRGTRHRVTFPLTGSAAAIGRLQCGVDRAIADYRRRQKAAAYDREAAAYRAYDDSLIAVGRARLEAENGRRSVAISGLIDYQMLNTPELHQSADVWTSLKSPNNTAADTTRVLREIRAILDPESGLEDLMVQPDRALEAPDLWAVVSVRWSSRSCGYRTGLEQRLQRFWSAVWPGEAARVSARLPDSGEAVYWCE